jgi:hypothetical protein
MNRAMYLESGSNWKNRNISNYFFNRNKNFINSGLFNFLVQMRTGMLWIGERLSRIYHYGNGKSQFRMNAHLKDFINCYRDNMKLMTVGTITFLRYSAEA